MEIKRLRSIKYFLVLSFIILIVSCSDDVSVPMHADFNIGASRDEITAQFGNPIRIQTFTKQGQPIWGAIESYWELVPDGSTVEIWAYPSKINLQDADMVYIQEGETELYFLDASEIVSAKGFHIEGVVYEGRV